MSEPTQPDPDVEEHSGAEQVRTGDPTVDEVLAAVESLEERPLEEHVGVFEQAHQQLRRALDAARSSSSDDDKS